MFPWFHCQALFLWGKEVSYACNFGLGPNFKLLLLKDCKCAEFYTLLFNETLNRSNKKKATGYPYEVLEYRNEKDMYSLLYFSIHWTLDK